MEESKIYKTDNLSLAPYLDKEGLKYIGYDIESSNDIVNKIVFLFEDPRGIGSELALAFTSSPERVYRNKYGFFRNEIETAKKKLRRGV